MKLVLDEDQPAVDFAIDKSIQERSTIDVEFRGVTHDESLRWLRLQGKMLQQPDNKLHMIGVIQNVTERKQAEKSLQQASMVFEATQDGILILDDKGNVITCNSSFTLITGYAEADMVGEKPFLLHRDALRRDQLVTLKNVLNQGGKWRGEIQITRKSGESIPTLVSIATVYD